MQNLRLHVRPWQYCLAVALLTFAVFGLSVRNGFVTLDDGLLIYRNAAVQELTPRSLGYIFTHFDPELYVPLTLLSYQVENLIFGLHPAVYHFDSLLLHIGSAMLLFLIFRRLLKDDVAAFMGALLFAIHPLQTEAVAWASARKDVLSGFFFFVSVLQYLRYRESHRDASWWGSVIAFLLGLLSKVSIIVLPVFLLLIDWLEDGVMSTKKIMQKWPYFLLSAIFGIVALIGKTHGLQAIGPFQTLLLACKSFVFYLSKILWPFGLAAIYPQLTPVTITSFDFWLPALVTVIFIFASIWFLIREKFRAIGFGMLLFILMVAVNSTNFSKNEFLFFASDRYAYLASVGIFFLAALFLRSLFHRSWSGVTMSITCVILVLLGVQTFAQARMWKSGETLYRYNLTLYPQSAMVLNNLAVILIRDGRTEEGMQYVSKALTYKPDLVAALINKGTILKQQGDTKGALEAYKAAVAVAAKKQVLNLDQLGPYYYLGDLLDSMGDTDGSIAVFSEATKKAPMYGEPFYNLALIYHKHGRLDEAVAAYEQCLHNDPDYIAARYHLAEIYAGQGKLAQAVTELEKVIAVDPLYEKAQAHLAEIRRLMK